MKIYFFLLLAGVVPLIRTAEIDGQPRRRTKRDEEISKEQIKGYHDEFFTEFLVTSDNCVKESDMHKYWDYKTKQCVPCNENTNGIGSSFLCGKPYTNVELKKQNLYWKNLLIETSKCWENSYEQYYDAETRQCKSCKETNNKDIYDYFCSEYQWRQECGKIKNIVVILFVIFLLFLVASLGISAYFFKDLLTQKSAKKDGEMGSKKDKMDKNDEEKGSKKDKKDKNDEEMRIEKNKNGEETKPMVSSENKT